MVDSLPSRILRHTEKPNRTSVLCAMQASTLIDPTLTTSTVMESPVLLAVSCVGGAIVFSVQIPRPPCVMVYVI